MEAVLRYYERALQYEMKCKSLEDTHLETGWVYFRYQQRIDMFIDNMFRAVLDMRPAWAFHPFPIHVAWQNGNLADLVQDKIKILQSPKLSTARRLEIAAAMVWRDWSDEAMRFEQCVADRDFTYAELYDACYAEELSSVASILIDISGSRTILDDVWTTAWRQWIEE